MRVHKSVLRISLIISLLISSANSLLADEGMWLISQIHKNIESMQRLGLALSAEDIYSINQSSLKDAVVSLDDGGCSAELISPKGLILTNHHCAVPDIQMHSSPDNNLIANGFWANAIGEELPIPGKTALILKLVEDVTERVLSGNRSYGLDNENYVYDQIKAIEEEAINRENFIYAKVIPMFNSNQFFLFTYHRYTDVRLVGAPPASIGNFGGDVDNWRWPRHTGDFALYRIYASPSGMPADYSKRNKPYQPKHYFPVSLEGVNEGDFTMVIGYPGSTHRHSTSFHAMHERDVVAPWIDEVWAQFISVIKDEMTADSKAKVNLTDTHDMLVNFWQKDTYQAQSMYRFSVVERMQEREQLIAEQIQQDSSSSVNYSQALKSINDYYTNIHNNNYEQQYRALNALLYWPVSLGEIVYELYDLFWLMFDENMSKRKIKREAKNIAKNIPQLYDSYFIDLDKQLYTNALISLVKYLPSDVDDPFLSELKKIEFPDLIIPFMVNSFFETSNFSSSQRMQQFLKDPTIDSLNNDPLFMLHLSFESLMTQIQDSIIPKRKNLLRAQKEFTRNLIALYADSLVYPDANSTMRLSYGKVAGYKPRDGVWYKHITYLDGKMQKENPIEYVFNVSPIIKDIWERKDFEPYADENGIPICFITDNDITNGNSGSPVLNAKGHLVGVAFDGNYEAMACDFIYEPNMQRTIVTDIRYVLFVIDRFAGSKYLLEEMTIINEREE